MSTQAVDEAVDRFVRNGFALVAASPEHDGVGLIAQFIEKVLHERRFADARRPGDEYRRETAGLARLKRFAQAIQLLLPADEESLAGSSDVEWYYLRSPVPCDLQNLRRSRSLRRIGVKKAQAEVLQITWDTGGVVADRTG